MPGSVAQLKQAIDTNDLDSMKKLMTDQPELHRAPLGYGNNGPLTWVAECRVPWEPPGPTRLAMADWMIRNGSDVHQGGDGPLMRAALGDRVPMMELLVSHGADANALWNGNFPIIFAPCETVDPVALQWLLDRGANPNCANPDHYHPGTALDYVIGSYSRSGKLSDCIKILLNAGCQTKYQIPVVLDLLRNRLDLLEGHLDRDPALVSKRFPELDFGTTGGRLLTLQGATLLHIAVEYGNLKAATLILERGASVNDRAALDQAGVGGQTALFHAATQFDDNGLPLVQLLLEQGADLSLRVKLPGHYERPGEVVECTPLGYARLFPGADGNRETIELLRKYSAAD